MNVNRAFSRMPKMFRPAIAQMISSTRDIIRGCDWDKNGKKETAFNMALTAERQAVRM
jgi:hypothetical protein